MLIYHSKLKDFKNRITVVGEFDEETSKLSIAVSRCSTADNFSKKSVYTPPVGEIEIIVDGRKYIKKAVKGLYIMGGVERALDRLSNGDIFVSFDMLSCTPKQFVTIAKGVAMEAQNAKRVELCKR